MNSANIISPVFIGNLVFAKASCNYISNTSMEIGVRIEAECLRTGTHTHVGSAYLTFDALDENDKPTSVPKLILETKEVKRRFEDAKKRRETRLHHVKKHKHTQQLCIARPEK